jgi:hypothetical protein
MASLGSTSYVSVPGLDHTHESAGDTGSSDVDHQYRNPSGKGRDTIEISISDYILTTLQNASRYTSSPQKHKAVPAPWLGISAYESTTLQATCRFSQAPFLRQAASLILSILQAVPVRVQYTIFPHLK